MTFKNKSKFKFTEIFLILF